MHSLSPYQRIQTARLLLCPVDFWRYYEFAAVIGAYNGALRILDIGSPKVVALHLARTAGAHVTSVDITDTLEEECALYDRAAGRGAVSARLADGTSLPFEDGAFRFVYSVSVIEHIVDDGDCLALAELGRVLAPGGHAVVTVPVWREPGEIWQERDPFGRQPRDGDGRIFFSRIYSLGQVHSRLVPASGLELEHLAVWEIRNPTRYTRYLEAVDEPRSLRAVSRKLFDPWHAFRGVRRVEGADPDVSNRGVAALILRKPV
jgi:SAM-dependent methyltransferase